MLHDIPSHYALIGSTIVAIIMGSFVMFVRMKSQKKPVNAKKIIIPPIAMSSGALMFLFEEFRVMPLQILEATVVGALFSTVLIATSKFEVRDSAIFLKRSKAFFLILVLLLVLRVLLKVFLSDSLDLGELSGMFWILAFAMILPWRIAMLWQYLKLRKSNIVQ